MRIKTKLYVIIAQVTGTFISIPTCRIRIMADFE